MLGLFGIIKRDLVQKGKIPLEFVKNTIYDSDGNEFIGDTIHEVLFKRYTLLNPSYANLPINLLAKPWECSCCVDLAYIPSDVLGTQICIDLMAKYQTLQQYQETHNKTLPIIIAVKCNAKNFQMFEYETNYPNYNLEAQASNLVKKGKNYIKLEYKPTSETTGTFYAYYSLNGESWVKFGTKSYKILGEDFIPNTVGIRSVVTSSVGTVQIDSIRFIYDNEILFSRQN